jgi:endoglucanase
MTAESKTQSATAFDANRLLARTLNVGLDLGAPEERAWTVEVSDDQLERCAQAGFTAIRLVVSLALHRVAADSHRLQPHVLERLDALIDGALERGIAVVLANMQDPELMADPSGHRDRLLACTRQLAGAIRHHGATVLLEPLSEPQLELDALWNSYLADLCATFLTSIPRGRWSRGPAATTTPAS